MPWLRQVIERLDATDREYRGLQACPYTHARSYDSIDDAAENERAAVAEFRVVNHLEASSAGINPHDKLTPAVSRGGAHLRTRRRRLHGKLGCLFPPALARLAYSDRTADRSRQANHTHR